MPPTGQADLRQRSRAYSNRKYGSAIAAELYVLVLLVFFAVSPVSRGYQVLIQSLVNHPAAAGPAYLLLLSLVYYLVSFPLHFYQSFILEHQFGLTNQSVRGWFLDECKAGLISSILAVIAWEALYVCVAVFSATWWLMLSCFWVVLSIVMAWLAPLVIIPFFFTYKRYRAESLRQRIIALARTMGIAILDVYEIDFSRRSLKGNAALIGWGRSRRVLLADTLRDRYTDEEILTIIAHEFAHQKLRHIPLLMAMRSGATFLFFYLLQLLSGPVLRMQGIAAINESASLPFILLALTLFTMLARPLENYFSRLIERDADRAAVAATGERAAFSSAMEKLAGQNLADRSPSLLIKWLFFDHPPIDERIASVS